jgi:DNA-binding ferritin-like protein
MELIGRLIGTLFLSREYAHRAHLRVTGVGSFAKHTALGEFYLAIIDKADTLTEACQGRYDLIVDIPYLPMPEEDDPVKALESFLEDIEKMRYDAIDKKDSALQNIIDEAVATFLSTLYKLRKLK